MGVQFRPMQRYGRVTWLAGSVLLMLLAAFLFCVSQAYREKHQAERFLGALRQIRVGSTDRDAALRMTRPFRKHMDEGIDGAGLPVLSFAFDNLWLGRLKLAPYTDFRAWITLRNDVVVEKRARMFASGSGCGVSVVEDVHGYGIVDEIEPNEHSDRHVFVSSPNTTPSRISVYEDNTVEEAHRNADWNLNLLCLTRFGGCTDARAMFGDEAAISKTPSTPND